MRLTANALTKKLKERIVREFFRTLSYQKKNVIDDLLTDRPFDRSGQWEKKFLAAMRHAYKHHAAHSGFYSNLSRIRGFDEKKLVSFDDVWEIPYVLSDVFKSYVIETKTGDFFKTEFTSSGTSGEKSRVMIDSLSARRIMFSIYQIHKALGLVSSKPANYIMMSYNPDLDYTVGTTNSNIAMSYLTPRKSVFYALDKNDKGQTGFLIDRTVETLKGFIEEGLPIRMLGFIHHICETVRAYNKKYGRVLFPADSFIIYGGGWKDKTNPYNEKFTLFDFLKENTNLDMKNVRDLYTLSEHPIFYLQCEDHNMHIPSMGLACARDPRTLYRLGYGETGLIHLYSPIVDSCPAISLLTTDYGYIGESCTCSIGGPYIKIIGRAGMTKKVTCALTADQYIKDTAKV